MASNIRQGQTVYTFRGNESKAYMVERVLDKNMFISADGELINIDSMGMIATRARQAKDVDFDTEIE